MLPSACNAGAVPGIPGIAGYLLWPPIPHPASQNCQPQVTIATQHYARPKADIMRYFVRIFSDARTAPIDASLASKEHINTPRH